MKKGLVLQKQELLESVAKNLAHDLVVELGVIETMIDNEELVTDVIEIHCDFMDYKLQMSLNEITDFYRYENKKVIIELTDLREFISKEYGVEVTEIYDFFECNLFGEMLECLLFELA